MTLSHICNIQTLGNGYLVHFALFGWLWNNIMGQNNFHSQNIPNSKKISRNMQGVNSSSCRHRFEKLDILNIPSLYIYPLMSFAVDNLHYFQTNSSLHNINTRYNINFMYLQLLFLLYRCTTYCAIRIFNKLPIGTAGL